VVIRTDRERDAEEELRVHTSSSPRLTGGDVDADWQRADSVGDALGVSRGPDEEFRPSAEILERRDRDRSEKEE
jgi:hypothetical protein